MFAICCSVNPVPSKDAAKSMLPQQLQCVLTMMHYGTNIGIRYLDGGSRTAGEGTSNFVLFDDKLPRILERNGVPTGLEPWKPGEWGNVGLYPYAMPVGAGLLGSMYLLPREDMQ